MTPPELGFTQSAFDGKYWELNLPVAEPTLQLTFDSQINKLTAHFERPEDIALVTDPRVWELGKVEFKTWITNPLPEGFDMQGCCERGYHDFEKRVHDYLISQGWTLITNFVTIEGDSFGPLMRKGKYNMPFTGTQAVLPVSLLHG